MACLTKPTHIVSALGIAHMGRNGQADAPIDMVRHEDECLGSSTCSITVVRSLFSHSLPKIIPRSSHTIVSALLDHSQKRHLISHVVVSSCALIPQFQVHSEIYRTSIAASVARLQATMNWMMTKREQSFPQLSQS